MKNKIVSIILKSAFMGVALLVLAGCERDKISFEEVFAFVSKDYSRYCRGMVDNNRWKYKKSEFIPPSELESKEKGLIGACIYEETPNITDSIVWGRHYSETRLKSSKERNDELKAMCSVSEEPRRAKTGFYKMDKDGALLIDNKYEVIETIDRAEFKLDKRGSICTKREVYKLVKREQ